MNTETNGERLQRLRRAAGLSQKELARQSGVHHVNICKMEAGRLKISGRSLLRLARVLKANPFDLASDDPVKICQKN